MKGQLKWADVAHMYINSEIQAVYDGDMVFFVECRANLLMYQYCEEARQDFPLEDIDVKPILRHLGDMTPSEIIECLMLSWPEQTKWTVKSYETFPDHSIFGHAFRYKIEFNENPPSSCCGTLSFNSLCPKQFHWCYGRGFDMNRLIESGEAIRKEATNVD